MSNLTAVNSVIMLSIAGLYPQAQQLVGYTADDVFDLEDIDVAETVMGIDGILSAGLIYVAIPWTITLQGNSTSSDIFDNWYQFQLAQGDVTPAAMNITLPGLKRKWVYGNGFLKKYSPAPSVKKLIQPRKFMIEWNSIAVAPQ